MLSAQVGAGGPGHRGLVLNASRRRCCLHLDHLDLDLAAEECSTPHGVVAVCTAATATKALSPPCAQRLTASLLSAPGLSSVGSTAARGAQRLTASLLSARGSVARPGRGCRVLNASRRRCCLHTSSHSHESSATMKCSTPHGVVAVCTRRSCWCRWRSRVLNASRRRCCLHLPRPQRGRRGRRLCSTPHGVVAVCTGWAPGRPRRPACAQRLTASLLSAPHPLPGDPDTSKVLNASRRRCCLHPPGR